MLFMLIFMYHLMKCHPFFISYHLKHKSWHHANAYTHSCILVTETPENEPIEPTKIVEPEPGVEFMVEPEDNQGKQLSMILFLV
jgi:hypothetical protein